MKLKVFDHWLVQENHAIGLRLLFRSVTRVPLKAFRLARSSTTCLCITCLQAYTIMHDKIQVLKKVSLNCTWIYT